MDAKILVGCAGWAIPRESAPHFPTEGSHLERYARRMSAVEIDSSFYRSHLPSTYARWASRVPPDFRFAVKVPKEVTHVRRLADASGLDRFLMETRELGVKLGAWLVQLPPHLAFDPLVAGRFFEGVRQRFEGSVVCEPRHASWFGQEAEAVLQDFRVARAAVDPAIHPAGTIPGGWKGFVYYRLHGSPQRYRSSYADEFLRSFAGELKEMAREIPVWCIFNNTAGGAAIENALTLLVHLGRVPLP